MKNDFTGKEYTMKKARIIAVFTAIILCISSFGSICAATEITSPYIQKTINDTGDTVYSGTRDIAGTVYSGETNIGGTIQWSFNDKTKTLTFSGEGFINDYSSSTMTDWYPLRDRIEKVVIGEGIKYIGRENFAQLENLKSVTLPKSLINISVYAFMGCKNLQDITLPEGLLCIGTHAFYGCESLKEINIPASLVEIGPYAFYGLESLESYSVDENNLYFSSDSFGVLYSKDKTSLISFPIKSKVENYKVPASVKIINKIAFHNAKNLKNVTFAKNSSLEEIGENAFSECKALVKITIPAQVKTIGESAFFGCESLKEVVLPEKLERISANSFSRTAIEQIKIPSSVKTIAREAFAMTNLKSVIIPEGVETLENNIFAYCKNLKSVEVPSTVTSLVSDHTGTFKGADALEKITVSPDNPYFISDEYGVLYNKEKTELLHFPVKANVTEYNVPEGVISLTHSAFLGATQLKKVTLPEGLINISHGAFMRCENLESVNIPASVTWIGNNAFHFCHNLLYSFPENSSLYSIGNSAFSYNRVTKEIEIPESVMHILDQAFSFNTALVSVTIPEGSKLGEGIARNAFVGCDRMTLYAPKASEAEKRAKELGIPLDISVIVYGSPVEFDRMPVISNGRTMVPIRALFETLGGMVEYNTITKTVTAYVLDKTVVMTVGNEVFTIDGVEYPLDAPAIILADRTLVPIRAICEAFGFDVSWNDKDRIVTIK